MLIAAYHSKCIDPWLTKSRRVCPVCKRKVFARDERIMSDTDSDTDDERAPLVRSAATAGTAGGGTFARQRVKYFV
jgi:E3 ubiquitin-protein ligase RNF13